MTSDWAGEGQVQQECDESHSFQLVVDWWLKIDAGYFVGDSPTLGGCYVADLQPHGDVCCGGELLQQPATGPLIASRVLIGDGAVWTTPREMTRPPMRRLR